MNWEDGPLDPDEAGIDTSDACEECDCDDPTAVDGLADECDCSCHTEHEPDYEAILADRAEEAGYLAEQSYEKWVGGL